MPTPPLCFVIMPFNVKPDPAGGPGINFDRIYEAAIKPGITAAGMEPVRADEEKLGGVIHQAMFERLLWCDFAIADLTTSNPNVLYELGVRHAARPRTTLTVYATQRPLPFDVHLLRTAAYELGPDNTFPDSNAEVLRATITIRLRELEHLARTEEPTDSPLFQLVSSWRPEVPRPTTAESFRAQILAAEQAKRQLRDVAATAPGGGPTAEAAAALDEIRWTVLAQPSEDISVLVTLLLTHRAIGDWNGMIDTCERLPPGVRDQAVIRQQLAFALNRRAEEADQASPGSGRGDRSRALGILEDLEREQGPSSETCGLLGRIYKSQWLHALAAGERAAKGYLRQSIDAYIRGFETDWRDFYPGVNAVTLLDVEGSDGSQQRKARLLPVVQFAVEQRGRAPHRDYWYWATLLELAVLTDDPADAERCLEMALAVNDESWKPITTAGNLEMIADAREQRGVDTAWLREMIGDLRRR